MLPAVIFFYCAVMRRKVLHMLLAGEITLPFGGVYFLASVWLILPEITNDSLLRRKEYLRWYVDRERRICYHYL